MNKKYEKLMDLAAKESVSDAKLGHIIELLREDSKVEAERAFNKSMADLQREIPVIARGAQAHNTKYARLEDLDSKIKPIYTKLGFSVVFDTFSKGDEVIVYVAEVRHIDGFSKTASVKLPDDTSGNKNNVQSKGSAMSYARRYLLMMIFNIVTCDEDDDGNLGENYLITDSQADALNSLLDKTESDRDKFLDFMGVKSVQLIAAADYNKAMNLLKKKAKK